MFRLDDRAATPAPRPSPRAAAARIGLWLCAVLGFAVCAHWAARGLPGYSAAAIVLGLLVVWPLLREIALRTRQRTPALEVGSFGLRIGGASAAVLPWGELSRIDLVTGGRHGARQDLRFRLVCGAAAPVSEVSAEDAARCGLCAAVEAYLGSLDEAAMLAALAAQGPACRTVWQRGEPPGAKAQPARLGSGPTLAY